MQCPLCTDFSVPTLQLLLRHIGRAHGNCEGFQITCGVEGCQTTFRNFRCFKNHLRRDHHLLGTKETEEAGSFNSLDQDPFTEDPGNEPQVLQDNAPPDPLQQLKQRALWILKLKERRKLTQVTLDEVLHDVTELCTDLVTLLGESVMELLKSAGVSLECVPGLQELFAEDSDFCKPFKNLDTHYKQLAFSRAHFNLVVSVTHIQPFSSAGLSRNSQMFLCDFSI